MEREPGRLRVRYATTRSEHIDDVLVAEDDECVVVYATVCTPIINAERHLMESPHHVYLERPLGGRKVFDGVTGREVPYRNVYDELREGGLLGPDNGFGGDDEDWGADALDPPSSLDYGDLAETA